MAIAPKDDVQNTNPASGDYPEGSAKDSTGPLTFDGTPYNETVLNDIWGFLQSILVAGVVPPNNSPDSVTNAQYLQALQNIFVQETEPNSVELANAFALYLSNLNAKLLFNGDDNLTATARIAHEANVISQFIIRIATRLDGGGSRYIGNNGAAEILAQYTNDGNLVARVAPVGVDGGVVNWGLGSNWQLGLDGLKVNGLFIDGHVFSNGNGFYQILPGGKIMQWGKATRGAAQHVQPFPVPFTDLNSVVVNATPNQVNIAKKEVSAMLNGITVNNFTYQVRDIDGNNATFESSQINWLAFGF